MNTIAAGFIFLGLFLNQDDLDEANRLSKKIDYVHLEDYEKDMVRNILEFNWDSQHQMVSNLLHFPRIMPEDKRVKWILKGLREEKQSYYVLAAATGVAGLKLHGKDSEEIVELLKNISTSQNGMVALRAFMSLADYLKHPKDTPFVMKFMKKSKSNLRYNSLDWLIENVKDRKELLSLFEDESIPEDVRLEAVERVNNSTDSEAQGKVKTRCFFSGILQRLFKIMRISKRFRCLIKGFTLGEVICK